MNVFFKKVLNHLFKKIQDQKEVIKHSLSNSLLLYLSLIQGFLRIKLLQEMALWLILMSLISRGPKNKKMNFQRLYLSWLNYVLMASIQEKWRKCIANSKNFLLGLEYSLGKMQAQKRMNGEKKFTIQVSLLSINDLQL